MQKKSSCKRSECKPFMHTSLFTTHTTMPTFSPVSSQSSNGTRMCVCVDRMYCELVEVCTTLAYPHIIISSFHTSSSTTPVLYTSSCIFKQFEDSELMGLKVHIHTHARARAHTHTHRYGCSKNWVFIII